jgi:regulator of sigma E protease
VANFEELRARLADKTGPIELQLLRRNPVEAPGATLWSVAPVTVSLPSPARPGAYGLEPSDMTVFVVQPGSAAEEAGLKRGDRVVQADGRNVYGWTDDLDAVLKAKGTQPVVLKVQRDGKLVDVTVTQHLRKTRDEAGVRATVPELGASPDYAAFGEGERVSVRYGIFEAARRSVTDTFGMVRGYTLGIVRIVTGHISTDAIGGPLMIADQARKAAEAGWMALLQTIALISVALGVMNLLPVPVLDGFHVLSAFIEGLRRRPLSLKFREYANVVGIALLLCLMLFAFRNDAMRKWFE